MYYTAVTHVPATLWNGPTCGTCNTPYVGTHECDPEALVRKANLLLDLARRRFDEIAERGTPVDITVQPRGGYDTSGCPCRPENGGSGMCGCILSGPQITCGE